MAPKPIFLDYNSTTPVAPHIFEAMKPYFSDDFGNPSSTQHIFGTAPAKEIENSRQKVAQNIGASSTEIVFTSGATESNNWVFWGLLKPNHKHHWVTTATEHKAVLEAALTLRSFNMDVTILPVDQFGQVDLTALEKSLHHDTRLISVIFANNEIGTINPIKEITALAHSKGILVHTDASQALGRMSINVNDLQIDLMSLTAHKIYGPKGCGALYIRNGINLRPLLIGGGQEDGRRAGTSNVAGIIGLAHACDYVCKIMNEEVPRLTNLREHLINQIRLEIPDVLLNGHPTERICNNISLSFPGRNPLRFMHEIKKIAVSSGAACLANGNTISYVLKAIGRTPEEAATTVRLGLGKFTTEDHVAIAIEEIVNAARLAKK